MAASSQKSIPPHLDEVAPLGPISPPLPSDPEVRAELFARIDRGVADVRAGRVLDWEELDRRMCAKHGLPRG